MWCWVSNLTTEELRDDAKLKSVGGNKNISGQQQENIFTKP